MTGASSSIIVFSDLNNFQLGVLVLSSLQDEVLLQNLRLGLVGPGVKFFGHLQLVGRGERYA